MGNQFNFTPNVESSTIPIQKTGRELNNVNINTIGRSFLFFLRKAEAAPNNVPINVDSIKLQPASHKVQGSA